MLPTAFSRISFNCADHTLFNTLFRIFVKFLKDVVVVNFDAVDVLIVDVLIGDVVVVDVVVVDVVVVNVVGVDEVVFDVVVVVVDVVGGSFKDIFMY